ncbi:MAG: Bug family tripartite tricarboxylate transporter substrate binding protein [Rhodospirillales bacterium]|jgi:tripartite-type tricarboxylate transporter receptor subunit TctC
MTKFMKTKLWFTACTMLGAGAVALLIAPAVEAKWPERTIEVVVKAGPGSGANVLGHKVAQILPKYLGGSAVALYKKGGSGAIAQAYIQKRKANGYQIFLDTTTTAIVLARGKVPFTGKSWIGVTRMQVDPQGVGVRADSQWKTYGDLAKWIKKNPGKLRWTGAHSVGMDPYTVDLLLKSAKLKKSSIKYVPSRKANKMKAMLLGNHVDAAILNPGEIIDQVKAGKLRMLGIAWNKRLKRHPEWPTFKEGGYDVQAAIWRGVLVKKGTPKKIVNALHKALVKVMKDPDYKKYLKSQTVLNGYMGGPKKFTKFFRGQVRDLKKHFGKKKKK